MKQTSVPEPRKFDQTFKGEAFLNRLHSGKSAAVVGDVAANQGQGVPGDFPNEFVELPGGWSPLFDFRDQVHGHRLIVFGR